MPSITVALILLPRGAMNWDDRAVSRNAGAFAAAMAEFEVQLSVELGELATITRWRRDDVLVEGVDVEPRNPMSLGFYWLDSGEFQFGIGSGRNRWELEDDPWDAALSIDLARSVIAGRVKQTVAAGRSHVAVTLADGVEFHDTAYWSRAGWIPRPGWKCRGETIEYEPYG